MIFRFVNPSVENETSSNKNMFNVPEIDSSMVKRLHPNSSTPKKNVTNQDKKIVEIHTLSSKLNKAKIIGKFSLIIIMFLFRTSASYIVDTSEYKCI